MIAGIFHSGSGLGDQLFRYITTRTLALDKGYEWGMMNPELFKGKGFMNLDMGKEIIGEFKEVNEKQVFQGDIDIRSFDPEIALIQDNTIIDGSFEDEKYWGHRLPEIREWLKLKKSTLYEYKVDEIPEDVCIINFRGGEYALYPDLFLPQEYWDKAIQIVRNKYPKIKFEVHTDDSNLADKFFPDFDIVQDIYWNWRAVRYAKHLILSNSAFGILPALLNENAKEVIAPRYWARRNTKTWARPACYYKKFTYI